MSAPKLIVMLTHNDRTVPNAAEIFEACRDAPAVNWGFKEVGLPLEEMKALFRHMKQCGKRTFLEVVAYTEAECLEGAKMAAACGVDVLMGTLFFDSINDYCKAHGLKYMPFVGKITGRPPRDWQALRSRAGYWGEVLEQGSRSFRRVYRERKGGGTWLPSSLVCRAATGYPARPRASTAAREARYFVSVTRMVGVSAMALPPFSLTL